MTSTVGGVLDYLATTKRPRLSDTIERIERLRAEWVEGTQNEDTPKIDRATKLRNVYYQQVVNLVQFIDGHTPFATKHSVKGEEYQNVLVVVGRGWNQYDFNQFLEWTATGVPAGRQATYERNRNLFYVCCSRPKTRLAVLFTQKLSPPALSTLATWFGQANIHAMQFP